MSNEAWEELHTEPKLATLFAVSGFLFRMTIYHFGYNGEK